MRRIYDQLGWSVEAFDSNLLPALRIYLGSRQQKTYKRNVFDTRTLTPALRRRLAVDWADGFDKFGYAPISLSDDDDDDDDDDVE